MSTKSDINLKTKCPLCGNSLYAHFKMPESGFKVACLSLKCNYEDIDVFKDKESIEKKGYTVA